MLEKFVPAPRRARVPHGLRAVPLAVHLHAYARRAGTRIGTQRHAAG